MFDKIFDSDKAKKDSKDRANDISKAAAETLAAIDPSNTLYPYRDAVEALITTVSPEILREGHDEGSRWHPWLALLGQLP